MDPYRGFSHSLGHQQRSSSLSRATPKQTSHPQEKNASQGTSAQDFSGLCLRQKVERFNQLPTKTQNEHLRTLSDPKDRAVWEYLMEHPEMQLCVYNSWDHETRAYVVSKLKADGSYYINTRGQAMPAPEKK